ncbi:neurotrophin 1 [Drosophila madeirensis]|uniref:Neurotrophin 1 n=1 Tax=Drosophila madeirensis TaxID=30013 RepID=A0AAU9EYT0_DROMD
MPGQRRAWIFLVNTGHRTQTLRKQRWLSPWFPALYSIQANDTRRWPTLSQIMSHPTVVSTINKENLDSADDSEEDVLRHPTLNGSDTNELHASSCAVGPY